ncbi:hypothetical protein GQ600_21893 [Phytophthora cactorum]|nr:hypothetical protein GQ600_21893 [Phytophthora cactorum]
MIVLLKTIRKGQGSNQNLVLDLGLLDVLDGVTCSPFGAVAKGSIAMEVDARNIHNLTFPHGESVNKHTPLKSYKGAAVVAQRMVKLSEGHDSKVMTGYVNAAFRRIPIHTDSMGRFRGQFQILESSSLT